MVNKGLMQVSMNVMKNRYGKNSVPMDTVKKIARMDLR